MKDKTTTVLLALFLGGFGIHRFYLRQTNMGILYLVFFWTLIPALIALIDTIIFLVMDEDEFNTKYNALQLQKQNSTSSADQLEKFHTLKEKGAISQEEYDNKKEELLK